MGLRELKRRKTRKAISDMATQLFLERGYNEVTTAEIAQRAEVSVPTLFKYFPTKESLVFDEDAEMEEKLIAAVENRKKEQSILDALLEHGIERMENLKDEEKKSFSCFVDLIEQTPELSAYSKKMWMRFELSLGKAIRKESGNSIAGLEAGAIAHFVLDSYHRTLGASQPKASLKRLFRMLKDGTDI